MTPRTKQDTASNNQSLADAKRAKNDEFYTQFADIEREMNAYLLHNPDVFRDKTILLPCDDPEWSKFTDYFAANFDRLGIKKLISTSYAPDSNHGGAFYAPTLFETDHPAYDEDKSRVKGRIFTLTKGIDISGDGKVGRDDITWDYLDGDGDFRSPEVTALRDEADFVITNPPFSLFREFIAWLIDGKVQFSVIGNMNAVTYKEVFPLIRDNKMWMGSGFHKGNAFFRVPESHQSEYAEGVYDPETQTVHFRNVAWFTNIDFKQRHEEMILMTMEDNLRYSRHKKIKEWGYPTYDNFDAIEVSHTDAIPSDYPGLMGVPVSFLDKYNPDQFEILGITQSWDDDSGLRTQKYPRHVQVSTTGVRSQSTALNGGAAIKVDIPPKTTYYKVGDELFVKTYQRLLIRHRQPEVARKVVA